jgi:hypothetical protein
MYLVGQWGKDTEVVYIYDLSMRHQFVVYDVQ